MPWRLPEDLARFKELTWGRPVLMGRRTWDSLPKRFRPLPGRTNLVLTRRRDWTASGATAVRSPAEALAGAERSGLPGPVWVIGGGSVYELFAPLATRAEVTVVGLDVDGDTRAPQLGAGWRRKTSEPATGWLVSRTGLRYRFETWLQRTLSRS
jgi:dihydrofolate reductase